MSYIYIYVGTGRQVGRWDGRKLAEEDDVELLERAVEHDHARVEVCRWMSTYEVGSGLGFGFGIG